MFSKIYNSWQILKGNLWFFPAFISVLYLSFTIGIYLIEVNHFQKFSLQNILFNGGSDDAKALLATLLSSMITMATLAISVTMVVLSLAASQLGPRLIRTFMSDRKTKIYIGLFFGAVVACFTLTMILHDAGPEDYIPRLVIMVVFIACFANLFVLLGFFHHVAQSSIADNIITKVASDLNTSLDRLTVNENSQTLKEPDKSDWPKDFDQKKEHIYFKRSGYVQNINYEQIASFAEKQGLYVQIFFKAGHFLVEGEDGVRIYPKNKLCEEVENYIRECFIIGDARTPTQDIEYSIRHLVEIGLRAQSPGQDDNFTAITVLDRLSAAMAILFKKETSPEWIEDDKGRVRVRAKQSNEADIIFSAFDQMRHSARDKPDIIYHILKKLKILCELAHTEAQKQGLLKQLKEIEYSLNYIDKLVLDIKDMKALCAALQKKVQSA